MTKKEKAYIQERANQFFQWAKEEEMDARRSNDPIEKEYHNDQASKNYSAGNACENLIIDLEMGV